jgi:predicted alpha/beta-hydrolase family hydrolase
MTTIRSTLNLDSAQKYHVVRRWKDIVANVERFDLAFGGRAMGVRQATTLASDMNTDNLNGPLWLGVYIVVPAPFAGE